MSKVDMISAQNEFLVKKWGRKIRAVESAIGPMDNHKRANLAVVLENTARRLHLNEAVLDNGATQSMDVGGNLGSYKRYALDMVAAVVPNVIANDIVSVQPIDGRVGMINYVSFRYGDTKGQAKEGQMFASALNMGNSDPNYTSTLVEGESLVVTSNAANLQWYKVIPGFTSVFNASGTLILKDTDANGRVGAANGNKIPLYDASGAAVSGASLDLVTGEIGGAAVTGFETGATATYRYNNEYAPLLGGNGGGPANAAEAINGEVSRGFYSHAVPQIQLDITSIPVVAQSRKLRALYSFDSAYELERAYGQDINTLLATEAAGEIAHEIDLEITFDLLRMAGAGAPVVWSKQQPYGVSVADHYDSFMAKLIEGSNTIFGATKKVQANFAVVGLGVASVMQVMRGFQPSGVTAVGPHLLGTLGQFKVYVSPDFPVNEFVLGYKGASFMDAGYVYAPYLPITPTDTVMLDDFAGRRGWATSYATKMVNNKMYVKGAITD